MKKISETNVNILLFIFVLNSILDIFGSIFPEFSTKINIIIVCFYLICFLILFSTIGISRHLIFYMFFAAILILITRDISRISIFVCFFIMSIRKYINLNKIIKPLLICNIVIICLVVIAYFFGFNKKFDTYIYRPSLGKEVYRYSFGFTHPNQFMIKIFFIYILSLLLSNSITLNLFWILLTYLLYNFTYSRTVFLIIIVISTIQILLNIFRMVGKRKNECSKTYILTISIPIMLIISIIFSYIFNGTAIDELFSGRLSINNELFNLYGVSLFGNKFLESYIFDNSYIQMLLTKGIIFFLLYSYAIYYHFRGCSFSKREIIIYIGILALAFMEVCLLKYDIMLLIGLLPVGYRKEIVNYDS